MRFASLIRMIAVAAAMAMPEPLRWNQRDMSATPRNPSPCGKNGRTVATDRRRAKKARNVARNRAAHR